MNLIKKLKLHIIIIICIGLISIFSCIQLCQGSYEINPMDVYNALTDKNKPLTAQGYYEALKEGLEIFFNDKATYSNMVRDSIDEDFSWAKEGRQGPVYDYLELLGIDRNSLPDVK